MKRLFPTLLLVLFLAVWAVSMAIGPRLKGSGTSKAEPRAVATFNKIELRGAFDVKVICQRDQSIDIQADDNLLPFIYSEVDGSTLKIGTRQKFSTRTPIQITITVPNLEALSLAGSGDVEVIEVNNQQLAINLAGSGDVRLSGTTKAVNLSLAGSGDIDAQELFSDSAKVSVAGSGNVVVNAEKDLETRIAGSGDVTYYGNPTNVVKKVAGSGSIHHGSSEN